MKPRKKLIGVSIPLEAINAASAREKSIRHGHPSTLHLWWARRPLAACRAVLFAQLVDDPSSWPEKFTTEEAIETERKRLHKLIGGTKESGYRTVSSPGKARITKTSSMPRAGRSRGRSPGVLARSRHQRAIPKRSSIIYRPRRRRFMTRSAAAARFRWKRSAWACAPTGPISTRSRC
jgi:adenine-specific DNA methylase